MMIEWEKKIKYIDLINQHLQYIWKNFPLAKPTELSHVKTTQDIWDWCDQCGVDFDVFERNVTFFALSKLSKVTEITVKFQNECYTVFSSLEQISISGGNLLILLSEYIKISEVITDPSEKEVIMIDGKKSHSFV